MFVAITISTRQLGGPRLFVRRGGNWKWHPIGRRFPNEATEESWGSDCGNITNAATEVCPEDIHDYG